MRVSLAVLKTHGRERRGADAGESGPAISPGLVFALFGGGLGVWTAVRLRQRGPVAHGVSPFAWVTVASAVALFAQALGAWCFGRV